MRRETVLVGVMLAGMAAVGGCGVRDYKPMAEQAPPAIATGNAPSAPGGPASAPGGAGGPGGSGGPGGAGGPAGAPASVGVLGSPAGGPSAVVDDPPGLITCARLAEAITNGTLMQPGVVDVILAASGTADAPVADAADRLDKAYDAAVTAAGKPTEPDAVAAVGAAASEMSGVCADSGLRSAG